MTDSPTARAWFADAAAGFLELVDTIGPADLDRPALGEWSVRDLIGHTGRAFSTVESYLAVEVPVDAQWLPDAAAYLAAVSRGTVDHSQVAERGRQAGQALGDDPASTVSELAQRVLALVDRTPDDAPAATLLGPMRLIDYLATRAFELTVHGLDLAYALGVEPPEPTRRTVGSALTLIVAVAVADADRAIPVLLALTGRKPLPVGFSLL